MSSATHLGLPEDCGNPQAMYSVFIYCGHACSITMLFLVNKNKQQEGEGPLTPNFLTKIT